MPHKSFFCPQCNPFSLQKWNALGPTIPKWCNTCILEAWKGGYQIGAWVPSGGQMAPCWYPPFWTSNIQVLHHFGIVRPRAFHFWRENRRVRGIKKEFRWRQYSVIGHLWPPENWFLPPFTPVFSSEMECSRSHDSEMVQHLYIRCSEGRIPAGGHLTPCWYPCPYLVPTLPGFQYTSVAPFWNRGT